MLRPSVVSVAVVLGLLAWWLIASGRWHVAERGNNDAAAPAADAAPAKRTTIDNRREQQSQGIAVEAVAVEAADTTMDLRSIGSLQSDEAVQISSEIAGRVTAIPFTEGVPVQEGDVLVELDDALVRAEVADTQARYDLATGNLGRANTLARSGNVTERARDEATANSATAQAALELAKTRLSKHVIKAPFSGTVGIRKISPGAYVAIGQPIVNLEKIDTLKVDFKLPELYLAQIAVGQRIEVEVDALPNKMFPGTIYAIDPLVDVNGRALAIRASLPNPDLVLRPGLFARIIVKGQATRKVLLVPESAIVPRGSDKIVYRIESGRAMETKVALGARRNGRVEILDGLKAGAAVVTAGQLKLKDGSAIEVIAGEPALGSGS